MEKVTYYFDIDENNFIEGWGDRRSDDSEIEIELEEDHEVFSAPEYYKIEDGKLTKDTSQALINKKEDMIDDLEDAKEERLISGFEASNGHTYSTTNNDQVAMLSQKELLNDEEGLKQVGWDTEDEGFIIHDREEWLQVFKESVKFRGRVKEECDDKKKEVEKSESIEELSAMDISLS